MPRRFDHIDLRAPRLTTVQIFYEALLPALGFTRRVDVEGWLQHPCVGTALRFVIASQFEPFASGATRTALETDSIEYHAIAGRVVT